MLVLILLLALSASSLAEKYLYHTYNGTRITEQEYQGYKEAGVDMFCVIEVEDCDPSEPRRLDGTCNNLQQPTRGGSHTPFTTLLPYVFDGVDGLRKSVSGKELKNSRKIRTSLLAEGHVPDEFLTNMLTQFWVYMAADGAFPLDSINYLYSKPPCCSSKGSTTPRCQQLRIPDDDLVHRFSGIRCQNFTKPLSYQNTGCINNGTTPQRINTATPLIDFDILYGSVLEKAMKARLNEGGLLRYEMLNGRMWPPSNPASGVCVLNTGPHETRCHDGPEATQNSLIGINIFTILYWRYHNYIAQELAKVNPTWDDERLFSKARDINIATAVKIYYYDMFPLMLGRENMINDGVITADGGFRDLYDPNTIPQISHEYLYALRWVHTMVETNFKLYDSDGNYIKNLPILNATFRTGYLAIDHNLDYITQSFFRQPCAKANDHVVDPDMAERAGGRLAQMIDILSLDNIKSRYFGLQPYTKYLELCSGKQYNSFDDLNKIIEKRYVDILKDNYEDVRDIDLLAGIWVEKPMKGGYVPPTFYCLVKDQLLRNIRTDRHWFERPNRPDGFTPEQLKEIQKVTISELLCQVGDAVTKIQPNAFLRAGPGNEIDLCSKTTEAHSIDFEVFRDSSSSDEY